MLLLEKLEQKRKYIILVMIIALVTGIVCSLFVVPKKSAAESTLMLIEKEVKSENEIISKSNLDLTEKMISNFEEIITSESSIRLVNESLNANININELKNKIQVSENLNSDTFKIIVINDDSNLAIKINEELIKVFSGKVKSIYANTDVYIVDNAHIEESTNYKLIIKALVLSIFAGILVNVIYAFALIEIDKIVKKSDDIESELSLKNLGKIPLNKTKNKLIGGSKKTFSIAFNDLRSNIQFINVNNKEKNIILITSSRKSEGKTLVASNLAISFAKTGKKVILVDADMSSGKVAQMFNMPNDLGLSNYLSGIDENGAEVNERINKFIKDTTIKNLNIITSGTIPPNPSELLSMPKFKDMIKDLSVFYDILILDSTPVLNETNALILTRLANSTIIVSNYRKTKKDDLWHTKRDIQNVGGRIIGIIINKVKIRENNREIYIKIKKVLKDIYLKIKEFINYIIKKINSKQKLLNEAKEESKKSVETNKQEKADIIIADVNTNEVKTNNETKNSDQITFEDIENKTNEIKETVDKEEIKVEEPLEENIEDATVAVSKYEKILLKLDIVKEKTLVVAKNIKEKSFVVAKNVKEKSSAVAKNLKEKSSVVAKSIKEKTIEITLKIKDFVKAKLPKKQVNSPEAESKKVKAEVIEEKEEAPVEIEEKQITKETETKVEEETKDAKTKFFDSLKKEATDKEKNENSVLVIVDAENGFCRAFSQSCFTERYVRGIDKTDGFVKANYSLALNNVKNIALMSKYEMTQKQADRVDPLVYSTLQEYDECVWIERKMSSNKAEEYALCMAKEYERTLGETKLNYKLRCQYLRKIELAKLQIEIDYKLDNVFSSSQITFTDKIAFLKYANAFENIRFKKKLENRQNNNKLEIKFDLKKVIELFKKFKVEEVKVKSVEELTKEISDTQNNKDYENYQIEEYKDYSQMTREEREEEQIRKEQEEMIRQQIKLKKEIKEQKAYEKEQRRKERNKKRLEQKKNREIKKQKAREEARIEEELSVDNLYPKTKYNKNI